MVSDTAAAEEQNVQSNSYKHNAWCDYNIQSPLHDNNIMFPSSRSTCARDFRCRRRSWWNAAGGQILPVGGPAGRDRNATSATLNSRSAAVGRGQDIFAKVQCDRVRDKY